MARVLGEIQQEKLGGGRILGDITSSTSLDGFSNASKPLISETASSPLEAGLQAGLEATKNVPSSAISFGKGLLEIIKNPIETAKGIGKVALGGVQKLIPKEQAQEENFNQFTSFLKQRYGSLENLERTATQDPFGFGTDVVGLITGGASLVGKGAEVAQGLSKVAQTVTKPVAKAGEKLAGGVKSTTEFGVSQATGLNRETITELIKNPQKFKEINPEIRQQTAQQVGEALDERLSELSDLGKEYEGIRTAMTPVTIPQGTITKVLDKYGVKLSEKGKIITSPESRPLSPTDRVALQDFIDNYGGQTELTSNSFLNTREALSNLSKFEQGKTSLPQQIARDLRAEYDAIGKKQISGLKELDEAYAPERQTLSQLKKDLFDPKTGELKDGAVSKIANITGKGKENLLERVKQIVPDIEDRVRVLKAVEDIEKASGLKVGTYVRSGIVGTGFVTGNIPAIIGAILAQPEIAVPLLKGYGYTGQKARPILEVLKTIANDVNNFKIPSPVVNFETK